MTDSRPNRWSTLREGCAALRELLIVLAIVAIVFAPATIRSILERAGIRSVAGLEFDATTLNESRDELLAAQAQVEELKLQLVATQQQFNQIAANTGNTQNPRFTEVSEMLAQSRRKLDVAENTLGRSRLKQDRVLRQMSSGGDGVSTAESESSSTVSHSPTTAERVLMPPQDLFNR